MRAVPPDENDGPVSVTLHVGQRHDGNQASDVEARSRRIETDVAGHGLPAQEIADIFLIGHLFDEPSFGKHIKRVHEFVPRSYSQISASGSSGRVERLADPANGRAFTAFFIH